MGARIAAALREARGPVGEQRGVRAIPAVAGEVARAIHAGHLLEPADDRAAQDQREHHVAGALTQPAQALGEEARDPDGERGQTHQPDEQGTARVDQVHRPPGVRADPGPGRTVKEEGVGDAPVQV